jgi:L-fucose/D-arabinose isomerase
MDMDPIIPKAVWGFNGTERPGTVYLATVLAAHNQKGLPAFSIYGRDVQDASDRLIPADVQEKLLRFARAGLAVARLRGKSYLSIGGVSMGIAGSIVDQAFFESYLGMRVESIDMSELTRRIDEGIFDPEEYSRALAWTKANCKEGREYNPPAKQRSRLQKNKDWETVVKMTQVARELMTGNPAWQNWASAKRPWAIMPSWVDSRGSATGLITFRTAILWRRCSTPRSIGTVSAKLSCLQLRTIA